MSKAETTTIDNIISSSNDNPAVAGDEDAGITQNTITKLSPELSQFYRSHNFGLDDDLSCLNNHNPWRFVRLHPSFVRSETLQLLTQELHEHNLKNNNNNHHHNPIVPLPVEWLDEQWGFYALPANFALSSSSCFRSGRLYGMDVSSGASVAALLTEDHDQPTTQQTTTTANMHCDPNEEIRVLDLCTSPGLKLLTMVDYFVTTSTTTSSSSSSTHMNNRPFRVVGVDVNPHRMDKCKAIVQKYLFATHSCTTTTKTTTSTIPFDTTIGRVQLYLADGTTFGRINHDDNVSHEHKNSVLVFDSTVAIQEFQQRGKRKRWNKSAKARYKRQLQHNIIVEKEKMTNNNNKTTNHDCSTTMNHRPLFDYVLVDAECSTDGSFKHIQQRLKMNTTTTVNAATTTASIITSSDTTTTTTTAHLSYQEENKRLTDTIQLAKLVALQRKLLVSGFGLLKAGGKLVYSTCSLSHDQNEDIVLWLLQRYPENAYLIPIHFPSIQNKSKYVVEGSIQGTVRFYPTCGRQKDTEDDGLLLGDGFFVAKIGKRNSM